MGISLTKRKGERKKKAPQLNQGAGRGGSRREKKPCLEKDRAEKAARRPPGTGEEKRGRLRKKGGDQG